MQKVILQAAADGKITTEILDPRSSANWEYRAMVYKALIGTEKNTNNFSSLALQSYVNALTNDPTNPNLRINIGGIYYMNKDYQNAVNNFARAVQLKPDYANAYYNLAHALKDGGAYPQAYVQLQVAKRLLPAESASLEQIDKELEEFKKLSDDAIAKAQQQKAQAAQVKAPDISTSTEAAKTAPVEKVNLATPSADEKVNPDAKIDVSEIENDRVPASDGANADKKNGETEAPLSKPAQ